MRIFKFFLICVLVFSPVSGFCQQQAGVETPDAPGAQDGSVIGTVIDIADAPVPGATVTLHGPAPSDEATATTNETGFFTYKTLHPGTAYHVSVTAKGFAEWTSPDIVLKPGQVLDLSSIRLQISVVETTVAAMTTEQIALEQVTIEEKQRVLGVIPNFYVVYDPNPVPLTTKLKYRLALKAATDPVTFIGAAFISGIDQAADTPDYQQGAAGYGQRFGANYVSGFTDIMIGGAVLPSILHQDPRYFYQGTGTNKSRVIHALSSPFICKGDNGKTQFNYSSIGGDLASGAISNLYYPESNRGPGLVFEGALVDSAGRMANALLQEFLLRKLTSHSRN